MTIPAKIRVNTPNVVHETIDGEAILLDLNTGNYFSLDGAGAVIWGFIDKTGDWKKAINILTAGNSQRSEEITASVTAFVTELMDEKLLVAGENVDSENINYELEVQLQACTNGFIPPKVNKYSDMQDLLLLDPIHEVDEKGWPESKETRGDE